jgi:hypothetical protein
MSTEEMNIPAIALVNEYFVHDAKSTASIKGMPGMRIVSETVPCECSVAEEIETGVFGVLDDIIAALTKPLTPEEAAPKKEIEKPSKIVFKGDFEEVNRFFYKRGWTDGLPIVPPTEEAVTKMLQGTDLPPDHIIGKIIPRLGKATVEKIAINDVMAGALPTFMPLLIAGVEALLDPNSAFDVWGVSTGSWAPFWIVNGPVRSDIHINSGCGALSPGNIANAAIGRAMGLIIKNIGGIRKGVEDMGVLGNPGKYSLVIAENEESSPWEPLHVERGFNPEDSTVTLFFPNSFDQTNVYSTDVKGILSTAVYNIFPGRSPEGLEAFLIIPSHAKALAKKGWTKKNIKAFISENTTTPFCRTARYLSFLSNVEDAPGKLRIDPQDPVHLIQKPENIMIVVAGGQGSFMGFLYGAGIYGKNFVTKKLTLPENWNKLVEQYKDLMPHYSNH